MNHCVLEVQVKEVPTLRYTQDNKTPIAEMEVQFDGLRADDPPGEIKVLGWGNMAEDLKNRIQIGQRLVVEGRLRMNILPRQDGTKEKRAELTLSRLHIISKQTSKETNTQPINQNFQPSTPSPEQTKGTSDPHDANQNIADWNSSPLIPDTDDIPF